MSDKVIIFDTTLRDGEQCPGASMNLREKMEVARQLARLDVDVIEAGFPVISDGDFEAVQRIATEVKEKTTVSNTWLAKRLHMGAPTRMSRCCAEAGDREEVQKLITRIKISTGES